MGFGFAFGFRVYGGLRVWGLGALALLLGFRVYGGLRVQGLGFGALASLLGFRVYGGLRVQGLGFWLWLWLWVKIQSQGLRFRTFFSLTKIMKRTHGLCLNKETRDEASWQQELQENANRHNLGHVCCSWPTSAVANSNNKNEKTRDTNSSYINDMSKKSNSNDNAQNNLILIISETPASSLIRATSVGCEL